MRKILKIKLLFVVCVFFHLNTLGQNTYIGRLVEQHTYSAPPSYKSYYVLETASNYHILKINSLPIASNKGLMFDNIEYFFDDIVEITGYLIPDYPDAPEIDHYIEIEAIKKWSLNQDIQRFCGMYLLEGTCKERTMGFTYSNEHYVLITEGIESDLLISGIADWNVYKAFMFDNAFFIPLHWIDDISGGQAAFLGGGEIRNDSLFLSYRGGGLSGVVECDCKGKKISSSDIVSPSESNNNKVYYDATKQVIVIDETLQNQSLIFELVDLQGKVIFKTNIGNPSIGIANLSKGVYLYRLFLNDKEVYFGKILK